MDVRRRGKRDEGSGRTQRVSTSAIISGKNAPRWAAPTMRRQVLGSKLAMSMEAGAATVVRSVTDQDGGVEQTSRWLLPKSTGANVQSAARMHVCAKCNRHEAIEDCHDIGCDGRRKRGGICLLFTWIPRM